MNYSIIQLPVLYAGQYFHGNATGIVATPALFRDKCTRNISGNGHERFFFSISLNIGIKSAINGYRRGLRRRACCRSAPNPAQSR